MSLKGEGSEVASAAARSSVESMVDADLPFHLSRALTTFSSTFSFFDERPMRPLRSYFFFDLFASRAEASMGGIAVRGVTGDVGGRARGAELMECAARLCD